MIATSSIPISAVDGYSISINSKSMYDLASSLMFMVTSMIQGINVATSVKRDIYMAYNTITPVANE